MVYIAEPISSGSYTETIYTIVSIMEGELK